MTQVIQAIYQGGVLRPLEDVSLKENERVEVEIRTNGDIEPIELARTPEQRKAVLDRIRARAEANGFRHTGPLPTRDELHERD